MRIRVHISSTHVKRQAWSITPALGDKDRWVPRASWPASLVKIVRCWFSWRSWLKSLRQLCNRGRHPMFCSGFYLCAHGCMYLHIQVQVLYTHIHKKVSMRHWHPNPFLYLLLVTEDISWCTFALITFTAAIIPTHKSYHLAFLYRCICICSVTEHSVWNVWILAHPIGSTVH